NDFRINAEKRRQLDDKLRRILNYRQVRDRVSREVIAGCRSLRDAVYELTLTERGLEPEWMERLRHVYPDCGPAEAVGADLVRYSIAALPGDQDRERVARRLAKDFAELFGARASLANRVEELLAEGHPARPVCRK